MSHVDHHPQPAAADPVPALELRGIDKWFGANHANRGVSLRVDRGTIHGIIGENGAGKTTVMSIVYGYLRPDSGAVLLNGAPLACRSPADAIRRGVGMVHQHFMLVDTFTALENVLLGAEGGRVIGPALARARTVLEQLARDYGLEVDLDRPVGELPVGAQQRVEILKALYRGADLLILDEPTGVLTPPEAIHLFRVLRALRGQGKTIVIITHKLREIMALTDRVTVMRQGRVVDTLTTAATTREELAERMVGRTVPLAVERPPSPADGAPVLEVERLRVRGPGGAERVRGVSFTVRAGEVVGIAGVSGNGQSELLEALAGMRPVAGGRVRLNGIDLTTRPDLFTAAGLRRLGVGHVPEDRQKVGLVTEFPAYENLILGHQDTAEAGGRLWLRWRAVKERCAAVMERYDVRPRDVALAAANFSGGNQQKLVLAREIERNPALLLVGQPTRGVDIGAIDFIHRRLMDLRAAGKAVLLVSVELDEILSLSDRILVMFDGAVVGELTPESADERQLGLMMAGASTQRPG